MAGIPLRLKGSETSGVGSANPTLPAGTPVYGLQEMTSSEIDDGIIYPILKEFARTDIAAPKTGELTILDTVGNIATTVVGDYVDTTRVYPVGTRSDVTTLGAYSEVDTTVYQYLTTVTEDLVRPLCFRNGSIHQMNDTEIMDTIITPALNRMTNRGLGSYHFSTNSPTDLSGNQLPGTWTSIFTITDRYKVGNIATNTVQTFIDNTIQPPTGPSVRTYTTDAASYDTTTRYTLWRKTAETDPASPRRPLKYANTAERGKHIAEMTNADIIKLVARFRNKIVETGIGKYVFQQNAPSSGTWARRGDRIDDLLNTIGTGSYTWGTTGTSTGLFTGFFSSTYTSTFMGVRAGPARSQYFGDTGGGSTAFFTPYYTVTSVRVSTRPEASTIIKSYINVTLLYYTAPVITGTTTIQGTDYLYVKRAN